MDTIILENVKSELKKELENIKLMLKAKGKVSERQYILELESYQEIWELAVDLRHALISTRDKKNIDESKKHLKENVPEKYFNFMLIVEKKSPFYFEGVYDQAYKLKHVYDFIYSNIEKIDVDVINKIQEEMDKLSLSIKHRMVDISI